jgi:signal transduction histidine kinase
MAHHTYRIAAEALTNAARHAHATRIDVRLSCGRDRLAVVVSDDGQGLPISSHDGGHGLAFMRGRAEALHGRLRIDAGPGGRGTKVELEIPLTTQGALT